MKILSLFNNKGGVGKTTLTYHLAHILAESKAKGGCGKKVLLMDLDPQSNLTIYAVNEKKIGEIWDKEKPFIDSEFQKAKNNLSPQDYSRILESHRTIHFLLKPTEEGISDETILAPPIMLNEQKTLGIIPGRLTLYKYESVIAQRWSAAYLGEPLSLRTITKIRRLAHAYAEKYGYDYIIMDTSPSLGTLNKVIISMADGFIIPAFPDLFSSYGIRNIGEAITLWKKEFTTMKSLLPSEQIIDFPNNFVNFLGYVIYNAKKYAGVNKWQLSQAHYHYAEAFPEIIEKNILADKPVPPEIIINPIGDTAIMHGHNTFPNQAQKYKVPMWDLPKLEKKLGKDATTIMGNQQKYFDLKGKYHEFAQDLLQRVAYLETAQEKVIVGS